MQTQLVPDNKLGHSGMSHAKWSNPSKKQLHELGQRRTSHICRRRALRRRLTPLRWQAHVYVSPPLRAQDVLCFHEGLFHCFPPILLHHREPILTLQDVTQHCYAITFHVHKFVSGILPGPHMAMVAKQVQTNILSQMASPAHVCQGYLQDFSGSHAL